jgi:hypothetical protein
MDVAGPSTLLPPIPHANVIWLTLVGLPMVVMACRLGWLLIKRGIRASAQRARLATEARELARFAEEVGVAAERATGTADRHRQHWLAVHAAVAESGQALEAVEAKVRRLDDAASIPAPPSPRTPAEYADREKYLHRAAMAAASRGQLSIFQLSDALAHHNGWDPRLHPACQELVLSRAIREHLTATHAAAVERERTAWQAAEAAAVAADSLRCEALDAAERAQRLRRWLRPAPAAAESTMVLPQQRAAVRQWQPATAR